MNYKLLKDLPDVKAGAIFKPMNDLGTSQRGEFYETTKINGKYAVYDKELIENTPSWFSPIPSHPTKKEIIDEQWKERGYSRLTAEFHREITAKCLDKHEESIKEQLIEKIEGVLWREDSLLDRATLHSVRSEICSLIRNFKSQ